MAKSKLSLFFLTSMARSTHECTYLPTGNRGFCPNKLCVIPYCWGVSLTDGLALMWHMLAKLSSAQSRGAISKNGCNDHDRVKLRRGFSQLSFMYVLFSFRIFLITHFRVVLSFQPPLDHNTYTVQCFDIRRLWWCNG